MVNMESDIRYRLFKIFKDKEPDSMYGTWLSEEHKKMRRWLCKVKKIDDEQLVDGLDPIYQLAFNGWLARNLNCEVLNTENENASQNHGD